MSITKPEEVTLEVTRIVALAARQRNAGLRVSAVKKAVRALRLTTVEACMVLGLGDDYGAVSTAETAMADHWSQAGHYGSHAAWLRATAEAAMVSEVLVQLAEDAPAVAS
jgi:hypothetical protein